MTEAKTSVDLFKERIHNLGLDKQLLPLIKCNGVQALMEFAFYEGFKSTHSQFNAEIPYVVNEHTLGTDSNTEIDEDPALVDMFQNLIKELTND